MSVPANSSINNLIVEIDGLKVWRSPFVEGISYKIYNSYDNYFTDYTNNSSPFDSSGVIPVLLIPYPEIYKNGDIIFNNNIISIREVISGETNTIPNINLFIFSDLLKLTGQFFGTGEFQINIDANVNYDIWGLYSRDILGLVSFIFSTNRPFNYTKMYIVYKNSVIYKLYFIFNNYQRIGSEDAILFRNRSTFDLRYCNIFSFTQELIKEGYIDVDIDIRNLDSVISVSDGKEIIILNL